MAKLSDLELKNDILDTPDQLDNLPEQFGTFQPPPQPGSFRVRFPQPGPLSEAFEVMDTKRGQRIYVNLRDDAALFIEQSPGGRYDKETMSTRISNAERKRGKSEDSLASDLDYLLQVTKYPGPRPKFGDNRAAADAFLATAGKSFGIDWEYQYSCNENKPIRVDDPQNGTLVLDGKDGRPEQKGCGKRYYQTNVDKIPNDKTGTMEYPQEITCECGAVLRAFGQIARFRE